MSEIQGEREPGEDKAHTVITLKGGGGGAKENKVVHTCVNT